MKSKFKLFNFTHFIMDTTTQFNLHHNIRINHGCDILKDVRNYEKLSRKIVRFRNHLRFNLHCKHQGVTPISLRLKSSCNNTEAQRIIQRAERQLLNTRISDTVRNLDRFVNGKTEVGNRLHECLPECTMREVEMVTSKAQMLEHQECKTRQIKKFDRLKSKKRDDACENNPVTDKWVKNVSGRDLSKHEMSVLKKGLNFAVSQDEIPVVDIITATETACRNLEKSEADELRSEVVSTIKGGKKLTSNISKSERKALKDLQRDKSVVILPADKGRCTVVMDRPAYVEKCNNMLKDTHTYKKLKKDPTTKYKKELSEFIRELKQKEEIDFVLSRQLYHTTEIPPKFYGLPKVHKHASAPHCQQCGLNNL